MMWYIKVIPADKTIDLGFTEEYETSWRYKEEVQGKAEAVCNRHILKKSHGVSAICKKQTDRACKKTYKATNKVDDLKKNPNDPKEIYKETKMTRIDTISMRRR